MKYELLYTKRAAGDIERLDTLARKRLATKILLLQENPVEKSKKLLHSTLGTYRYRVGDYRVIFDLDGRRVVILRVGHRKEIYR